MGMLLKHAYPAVKAWLLIVLFSLVTPLSAWAATLLGTSYHAFADAVTAVIPIVAGAFIHISTTIFFESGTRQHMLTFKKVWAMVLGIALAGLTLVLE